MRTHKEWMTQSVVDHLPNVVRDILKQFPVGGQDSVILAGGSIRDIVIGKPVKDYDLWIQDNTNGDCIINFIQERYDNCTLIRTNNSITISSPSFGVPIQIITRWTYNKTEDLLNQFDFNCCRWGCYYQDDAYCVVDADWNGDTYLRLLTYNPPIDRDEEQHGSLMRAFKLTRRGWRIKPETMLQLAYRTVYGQSDEENKWKAHAEEITKRTDVVICY